MCSCFGKLALTPVSDYYVFRVSHQAKHILVSGYSQNVMHVPSMTSCMTLNFCLFLFVFIFCIDLYFLFFYAPSAVCSSSSQGTGQTSGLQFMSHITSSQNTLIVPHNKNLQIQTQTHVRFTKNADFPGTTQNLRVFKDQRSF